MAERDVPWRLLGLGGAASLCCIGTSAIGGATLAGGAVAGGSIAGGVIAGGFGAGVAQVLVTVLTVGVLGLAWRLAGTNPKCERE